jgi:hypothetical protein
MSTMRRLTGTKKIVCDPVVRAVAGIPRFMLFVCRGFSSLSEIS